jgi:hypothetical protein
MKNALLKSLALCAILSLVFSYARDATAQGTTAIVVGQVTDSTGAVIPGATVTATEVNKGIEFLGKSNGVGDYVILNVTPGRYKVTAAAAGFETGEALNATLVIDQKLLLNFKLQPGKASATVVVTEAPTLLQTQSSETGEVMQSEQILALPLLGRNFYDLAFSSRGGPGKRQHQRI